jgi:hypothetical protein
MNSIINSFSSLLSQGQISEALQLRLEAIEQKARHYRQDLEAAKVSSAALGVVGLLLSANPLVAVIAGCGLAGYGYTILRDYQNTKRLCLLPLVRKGTGELLTDIGLAATNELLGADDPLLGVIGYVEPELAHEYELVMVAEAQLTGYLAHLPRESRSNAYRHILRHTWLRNSLKLPPLQDVAVAIASGSVPRDSQSLPPQKESVPDEVPAIDVPATPVTEKPVPPNESVAQKPVEAIPSPYPVPNSPAIVPKTNSQSPAQNNKWINNFVSQTALIWGNQGSGKSWMTRYIVKLKKDKGYRVVVLDPDSNRAEWEGIESYHDFEEIAEFLSWYVEELKGRYKAFNASNMTEDAWRAKLWTEGKAIALICEEVTTYVDLIEDKELLTQFFRLGLTKSRKQEMPLTFVSHNNNQTALGGIKGLANLIDKMLQLELQTDIDPDTLQPVASGKGAVKLDGSSQWVPVTLPKLERKITNFGDVQLTVVQQSDVQPERSTEPLNASEPDEVERLNALINKPFNDSEPSGLSEPFPLNLDPFSPGITPQERGEVVSFRRDGRSKEETIFLVWGAKKGGSKAYLAAKEKLDRILSESGLE